MSNAHLHPIFRRIVDEFNDYGPATTHALDPRNEPDERPWSDLTRAEKLERYAELSPREMVALLFEHDVDPDA